MNAFRIAPVQCMISKRAHLFESCDEDNTDCLNALRVLLEFNGAEVEGVACVKDARAVLPELHPHVLISDLSMPGEETSRR